MKAIALSKAFVSQISDLAVSEIPNPEPKSDDELVISISHAAVQHVDLLYARGLHQNNRSGLVKPPFVLGLEYAGVVEKVSKGSSSKFKKGDRVFGGGVGAFAEKFVAKETQLSLVPASWSLREAAGVGSSAAVSYGALIRCGGLRGGETVLVHAAAGGLGVLACQIALGVGAQVVATVGSERKVEVVKGLGVKDVLRYDVEGQEWEKEVLKLTGGQGVDLVYDTVGLVQRSIRCTKFGGRIVIAGFAGREGKMEQLAMNRVLLKNVQLRGYRYGETGRRSPAENAIVADGVAKMIADGKIKPIIYDEVYDGLESVPRALADSAARKIWGKAVIDIQPQLDREHAML